MPPPPLPQANQLLANYSNQLGVPPPAPLSSADGNLTFYALALYDNGTQVGKKPVGTDCPLWGAKL